MNVLVVGTGSIGARHLDNLIELGHTVYATDSSEANLAKVADRAAGTFATLDEALDTAKPDAAFICTFSNAHVESALACANTGCHVFVEKPLSVSTDGVDELVRVIDDRKLVSMVGCNMRFHPAFQAIKAALSENPSLERPLWAQLEFGYFLPLAKCDYESGYQANRSLGGNLIFDSIHELDCAVWYLGEPRRVVCTRSVVSDLKMDTEDCVDMIVKFASGAVANIHMDYLQHGYTRRQKVVCSGGTVVWDFTTARLGTITDSSSDWAWTDLPVEIYYNAMYVDEARHFLDCVSAGRETLNSVPASLPVLNLALAADRSCRTGVWETT